MATLTTDKNGTIVVSALRARANFGKLLRRVEDERRSLVIEKRGMPKAVLLSIRDYVKLAAPEPHGMSFADRSCLALGVQRRVTVLTAERKMKLVALPIKVKLIRNAH